MNRIYALLLCACTTGAMPDDAGTLDLATLEIDPSMIALESTDGSRPSHTFVAIGRTASGEAMEVSARFSLAHDRLGAIDEDGTFTASGRTGGEVEVIAHADGPLGQVEARATVRVHITLNVPADPGFPAPVLERLRDAEIEDEPFESASLVYPLEGARMPNNIVAPSIQWTPRGGGGDAYLVELESEHALVRAVAYDDGRTFRSSYDVPTSVWRAIADSAAGDDVAIRVHRLPSGSATLARGDARTIHLEDDGIFGTLYYWQVRVDPQASDVLRIDAASGERTSVFGEDRGGCVGCHALSHDGRRLAATMDGRASNWVTSIVDASSAPPADVVEPLEPAYHFLAFSPDGTRMLASRVEGVEGTEATRLVLLDADGAPVAADGLPTGDAGYPAWSPDGARVAWMDGGGDGPRGTSRATSIAIAEVDGDSFDVSILHEGSSLEESSPEGGATDSRPTWSPDSRFIVFAHGTRSVSAIDIGADPPRAGLYLIAREGGPAIRLDRGMGREGPVDAFWPVFSPFATERDGVVRFWLAFYSRMDYGNARAGTEGTGRRQLWVMSIDPARAEAGEDPSDPPYWLPGQDVRADDIAALWAPAACRARDESCSASSECCSGECAAADPSQPDVLTCRPPTACHRYGESCGEAADCCSGLECNLGVCGYVPPI
jgi:Tol biopolymer transport system component